MDFKVVNIEELEFGFPVDDNIALPDTSSMSNNSSVQQTVTARRREKVFELRKQGLQYKEIARKIRALYKRSPEYNYDNLPDGYDDSSVGTDVRQEVQRHIESKKSTVEEHVILEVQRIESMISSLWDRAIGNNKTGKAELKAIDRIIRLHKRKANLMGLDAPEQIDVLQRQMQEQETGFEYPSPDEVDNYKEIAEKLQEAEEQLEDEDDSSDTNVQVNGQRNEQSK